MSDQSRDILVVTADSIRYDYIDAMDFTSSFDVLRGTAPAHYTRPSLAGLLSSSFQSALQARVTCKTLATVLSDAGYNCIGLSASSQTDDLFGFNQGFDVYPRYIEPNSQGSRYRELLSSFDFVRKLYFRLRPPTADLSKFPRDEVLVDEAIEQYTNTEAPCFVWIHLLETHRPYGRGTDRLPESLIRKALISPDQLSDDEHNRIRRTYRESLSRADEQIARLYEAFDDPMFVFTADHGDEFGEDGRFFHQPHKRQVTDSLVSVPTVVDGISADTEQLSLFDLAPTIVEAVDAVQPDDWDGVPIQHGGSNPRVTFAPWNVQCSFRCETPDHQFIARDATVELDSEIGTDDAGDPSEQLRSQLQDLGYME